MIKPRVLRRGDRVAAISLSWGGPGTFPERYLAGKKGLEETFGVKVVETPHALRDATWIRANPRARADDLMNALSDPSIDGIISTIGGEESIRLLPYIDLDVIRSHPKVFMGFSDTTVTHFAFHKAGVVSFYGPSILTAFAEGGGILPYTEDAIRRTLFSTDAVGELRPNTIGWTTEFLDWSDPASFSRSRQLLPTKGPRFIQGSSVAEGRLLGGCIEVVDWLRGTTLWPSDDAWDGAILFIETSEEAPKPNDVARMLRSLGALGVITRVNGIIAGRPCRMMNSDEVAGFDPDAFESWVDKYDQAILMVVRDELGRDDLPIVTNMDFGHTDPLFVLPLGVVARIDIDQRSFSLRESGVADS